MGKRLPEPTPCVEAPWIEAPRHGTMYAYSRYGCRCAAAVAARHAWRRTWQATPAGHASCQRANRRQLASRRGPDGLTSRQRTARQREAEARRLAELGWAVSAIALRLGVNRRSVERYLNTSVASS